MFQAQTTTSQEERMQKFAKCSEVMMSPPPSMTSPLSSMTSTPSLVDDAETLVDDAKAVADDDTTRPAPQP